MITMKLCKCNVPDLQVELSVSTDRSDTKFSDIQDFVNSVNTRLGMTAPIEMRRCHEQSDHEVVVFHAFRKGWGE